MNEQDPVPSPEEFVRDIEQYLGRRTVVRDAVAEGQMLWVLLDADTKKPASETVLCEAHYRHEETRESVLEAIDDAAFIELIPEYVQYTDYEFILNCVACRGDV